MPVRSIGSGAISFGLVSIPVNLYVATSSESPSFNLLHAKCGSRIKQQRVCPVCKEVVERQDLVKGYEVEKNQYVRLSDDELKALEESLRINCETMMTVDESPVNVQGDAMFTDEVTRTIESLKCRVLCRS